MNDFNNKIIVFMSDEVPPDFHDALVTLVRGTQLLKAGRTGAPHFRTFRLTPNLTKVVWRSPKKTAEQSEVRACVPAPPLPPQAQ